MSARRTLILIAAMLVGALAAYVGYTITGGVTDDDTPVNEEYVEPGDPTVFLADDPGGSFKDAKFIRVRIDGMPCIVYKDKVGDGHGKYAYSGLTCDWHMSENNERGSEFP